MSKIRVRAVLPITIEAEIDPKKDFYEIREQVRDKLDLMFEAASVEWVIDSVESLEGVLPPEILWLLEE